MWNCIEGLCVAHMYFAVLKGSKSISEQGRWIQWFHVVPVSRYPKDLRKLKTIPNDPQCSFCNFLYILRHNHSYFRWCQMTSKRIQVVRYWGGLSWPGLHLAASGDKSSPWEVPIGTIVRQRVFSGERTQEGRRIFLPQFIYQFLGLKR